MDKKKMIIIATTVIATIAAIVLVFIMGNNKKTITYSIKFETDGGSVVMSQTVAKGEKASKPVDPTKDGYVFKEWLYQGKNYDFSSSVTTDLTLTAKWIEISQDSETFVVKFDSDGGTTIPNQVIEKGNNVEQPSDPIKEGYEFKGWTLNDELYNFDIIVEENLELKATWEKIEDEKNDSKKYTVTFNSNGGSNVSSQTVIEGNKVKQPSNPTRSGYTFNGWTLNGKAFDFNSKITGNITLVANWEKTVSYEAPTLKGELTTPETLGQYTYLLSINTDYYYNKYGDTVKMGYEVYEKVGSNYNKIGESGIANGALTTIKIEAGTSKTYVAKVYEINSKNEKIYSGYSNELTINHSGYEAPKLKSELTTPETLGMYTYLLDINSNDYYNKYGDHVTMGYEVYEKVGNSYNKIDESGMSNGKLITVKIEVGTSKTYVARVYGLNSKNEKVYSAYSNEITINHESYETPVLTSELISSETDKKSYSLDINTDYYYNKYSDHVTMGYEIYEKVGNSYNKVDESGITGGKIIEVEINSGTSKTYVARVYGLNSRSEKVYSNYSEEITLN